MTGPLDDWEWTCPCCGHRKRGLPDLAFREPAQATVAGTDPEVELVSRTDDLCVLEICGDRFHFVRCVLYLPVSGRGAFGFGVWSTLSEQNFRRYRESFDDDDQSKLGRMTGYLSNALPGWPDTMNLKLWIDPQDGGQRPQAVVMTDQDHHPLTRDQQQGIDADRLVALVAPLLPCDGRG